MRKYHILDQDILLANKEYVEVYNKFLSLLENDDDKKILHEIMFNEKYNGKIVGTGLWQRDNYGISIQRAVSYAYMLLCSRETLDYVVENDITLFHGTTSNALPSIIKNGLKSVDLLMESNINVVSGEKWSRINGHRSFISLTDVPDVAYGYSNISNKNKHVFPVVIATTDMVAENHGVITADFSLPEIGVRRTIPSEEIKAILVPSSRVQYVQTISNGIKVLPLELSKKFYYTWDGYSLGINEERFKKFKKKDKSFSMRDVINLIQNAVHYNVQSKGEENGKSK